MFNQVLEEANVFIQKQASVTRTDDEFTLHLITKKFIRSHKSMTVLNCLRLQSNPTLWWPFECDGDGEWIYERLLSNFLVVVSVISYNKNQVEDVWSVKLL